MPHKNADATSAFSPFAAFREWTRAQVFAEQSEQLRATRLRAVSLGAFALIGTALLIMAAVDPSTAGRRLVSLVGMGLIVGFVVLLSRRGYSTLGSWIFVLGQVALLTQRAWASGGVTASALPLFLVFVIMGGLLLGRRGGLLAALACFIGTASLIAGQRTGVIAVRADALPLATFLVFGIILCFALAVQTFVADAFRAALDRAQEEIAERKAAQARLDLALDLGDIGVWTFDVATQQFAADERTAVARGFADPRAGEFSRDEWRAQLHPDDREMARIWMTAALAGAPLWRTELRTLTAEGVTRHVVSAATSVRDDTGKVVRLVGITTDITLRKEAEIERVLLVRDLGERVKELKLLHATAVAAQRSWQTTRELLQYIVNEMPRAWHYPDHTEARIVLGEIDVMTPGWRETPLLLTIPLATHGQQGDITVVFTGANPGNNDPFFREERDLLVSLSEMIGAIIDSRETTRDLERLVEARTAEVRAARDAAEQAAMAKGAFLANMSHEIRTPMNAILGYEQLLQAEPGLTAAQRHKLDVIRTSGDHLLTLINDILDMSRLEAGRTVLSAQVFDLHALVHGVESMFTGQVEKRGISLDVLIDADVPRAVHADPGKVRQVMINLIGNAVKFTDAGGVRVHVRAAPVGKTQTVVSIDVADTGAGIDPAAFDLIFSAFGQAREGTMRGGTGLGLAISRSFARLMAGDITVRSTVGRGSTFTFAFTGTIVEGEVVPALGGPEVRRRLAPTETRRRILIVDDVPTNRDLLHESLTRAGFETRPASSGEDALVEHDAWHPDLIVMDLHMPGIGGFEAVRLLREGGATTPVIISTAATDRGIEQQALAAGAQRLLQKPHREHQLFDAIVEVLNVKFVPAEDAAPRLRNTPTTVKIPLWAMVENIPAELVGELREAARKARVARVIELAAVVEQHSPAAAQAILQFADEFRYGALLDALNGAPAGG